jgi:hypothetical protein
MSATVTSEDEDDFAPVRYAQRARPFSNEVSWRLDDDDFVVDNGRKTMRIPYGSVFTMRLTYRPANVTSQGYHLMLVLSDGRTVKASNLSWKGYVEVERQDADYRRLVGELALRCGRANPALICCAGQPAPLWIASTLGGIFMTGIFGAAVVWAALRGSWPLAFLAALFLLPFAGQAYGMITRNRPATFAPDRLPEAVLPPKA